MSIIPIRNLILLFVFQISWIGFSQTKNKSSNSFNKTFSIENCVTTYNLNDTINTKAGHQFWFVDKEFLDGRTLKLSVVAPNKATHAPHRHTEDEFFFVLEGKAEFYLNGKTTVAQPYTSFYCPPNSEHGIRNVGDKELKYLVIKKYIMK